MSAFVPPTIAASGAFTASRRSLSSPPTSTSPAAGARVAATPRMATANWPDDASAPYGKYLSNIPLDRLNKAPLIQITSLPAGGAGGEDNGSVGCSLKGVSSDAAVATALLNGLDADVLAEAAAAPPQEKWAKYYDPATVNTAPHITLYNPNEKNFTGWYVGVVNTPVPTNVLAGKDLVESATPDPALYAAPGPDRLDEAPVIQLNEADGDVKAEVSIEEADLELNA